MIHAYGILNLVESSLNYDFSAFQASHRAATVMLENYRSWHLEQATPTMRLTVVKCPALKRMGEQGKFNLPA